MQSLSITIKHFLGLQYFIKTNEKRNFNKQIILF